MAKKAANKRYIAFLRGINVGGHRVKMDDLAGLFAELGFANVSTFIASGNVIFDSNKKDAAVIERQIEDHLEQSLGYATATFVRTPGELAAAIAAAPFSLADDVVGKHSIHIGFLRESLGKEAARKLTAMANAIDEFNVNGREFYWLCRGSTMESPVGWPVIAKTLGMPSTMRNLTMLRKLAALHPAADPS